MPVCHFARRAISRGTRKTLWLEDFKYGSYTLHPHHIYSHNPLKCEEAIQKKTLDRFLQHTHLLERENYSSFSEKSLQSLLLPLSHCHTQRGDLYPNTIHTYSKCKECFGAWEVFGICQKKLVRLGGCNRVVLRDSKSQ